MEGPFLINHNEPIIGRHHNTPPQRPGPGSRLPRLRLSLSRSFDVLDSRGCRGFITKINMLYFNDIYLNGLGVDIVR